MHNNLQALTDITPTIRKLDRFRGMSDALVQQKTRILIEMEEANQYLDKKEEVSHVLEELQNRAQAKTKTLYEDLLTKLIHEVKGYDEENHRVSLKTRMKNSRPWLDVEVESASGHPRDVHLDKGGSIENIVAMGLRFVTLSRTTNRRAVFFDESDKHLSSKYVSGIARILFQLAKSIGMQVVYISHHDPAYFEGYAKIVNLTRQDGTVVSETVSDIDENAKGVSLPIDENNDPFMEDVGIKYVRLQNFKQHQNTLIELSPYVTVITGDIDIGKSTVIQAIDAVNRNKGREGLIRDDESFCRVEMGLEHNTSLTWTYKRRGSKRTRYSLSDHNNVEIQNSDSGTAIPDWLPSYLGMAMYKDFDLHVSDQHNASFILDSKISGHKRAEILSLGKETNQVMTMIKNHNTECEKFSKRLTQLKKELKEVKNRLECFRILNGAEDIAQQSVESQKEMISRENSMMSLKSQAEKLEYLRARAGSLSQIELTPENLEIPAIISSKKSNIIDALAILNDRKVAFQKLENTNDIETPVLIDTTEILSLGKRISSIKSRLSVLSKVANLQEIIPPNLTSGESKRKTIFTLSKLRDRNISLAGIPSFSIEPPGLRDLTAIITSGKLISLKRGNIEKHNNELKINESEMSSAIFERDSLIDKLGGACPVCGNSMSEEEHAHASV